MRQNNRPRPKPPARSRVNHLLREFVLEPLLTGVAILLLLGGSYLLAIFLGAR